MLGNLGEGAFCAAELLPSLINASSFTFFGCVFPGGSLMVRPVLEQYATSVQLYLPGNNVVRRKLVKGGGGGKH